MNKKLTSLLLALVMVFSLLATAAPAIAKSSEPAITIKVQPDKTEVNPGDTISYQVILGPVNNWADCEFTFVIPEGLTYVSATVSDVITEHFQGGWTEKTKRFVVYGGKYTSDSDTLLLTVTCTVEESAVGNNLKVYLYDPFFCDRTGDYVINGYDEGVSLYYDSGNSVTVKAPPVAVTGVTIDETLSVKIGESKTPTWTVNPAEATNKAVSFKSSDNTVATVNETTGEVIGVKEGTATITVTTADGNFTDTCVVTVSCAHAVKTIIPEKTSDCKTHGWEKYQKCEDCGQLFEIDGITEIDEIPFRPLSGEHTGGTATCTAQAVCTVCGNSYGDTLDHSYTAADAKAAALKSAGNCRDKAVYYYSCSACGKVENNDSHTFEGEKAATNHVGGSHVEGNLEPDHKNQVAGSTGATICDGCGATLSPAQPIQPGAHTPAGVYSNDAEYHWKECTVAGCNTVIDGSKEKHSSTGANVATCQKAAVCDVCGVSYGTVAPHDPATSLSKDASGHWYACKTSGCTEKIEFATHTPDHDGGATEEYAIKCSVCYYVIEAQLNHEHVFNQEVMDEQYKVSGATCLKPETYYKSCACGEKGTETFENGRLADHAWDDATCTAPQTCSVCGATEGEPNGHTMSQYYTGGENGHWLECDNCDYTTEVEPHVDEDDDKVCDVCNDELPEEPVDPEDPAEPETPTEEIPKTGDNAAMFLAIALLAVTGFGFVATAVIGKKKFVR